MELFISWSGPRSYQLGKTLGSWFRDRYEFTTFISSEIDKGSLWFQAVQERLGSADAGIVCLTPASLDSAWLLFEAGALATAVALRKSGSGRLYTYLHGVTPSDLPGPLQAYQSTVATREDTYRLVNSLLALAERQSVTELDFAPAWSTLDQELKLLPPERLSGIIPDLSLLFDRKTYREPIDECLDRAWLKRYQGARETHDELNSKLDHVKAECGRPTVELYRNLLAELDAYAMNMQSLLFSPNEFDLTHDGKLCIPAGVTAALERRRMAIICLVAQLTDPSQAPILDETVPFDRASCFSERKALIHRAERRIRDDGGFVKRANEQLTDLLDSDWAFDRIVGYLIGEARHRNGHDAAAAAAHELEAVRASRESPTLTPLYYALRWLRNASQDDRATQEDSDQLVHSVLTLLEERPNLDQGQQLRSLLAEIRRAAEEEAAP
jgi:hypothetical protein